MERSFEKNGCPTLLNNNFMEKLINKTIKGNKKFFSTIDSKVFFSFLNR